MENSETESADLSHVLWSETSERDDRDSALQSPPCQSSARTTERKRYVSIFSAVSSLSALTAL